LTSLSTIERVSLSLFHASPMEIYGGILLSLSIRPLQSMVGGDVGARGFPNGLGDMGQSTKTTGEGPVTHSICTER